MTDHSHKWVRVSRQLPCPICQKPDNCEVSQDGRTVWCGRVSDGSIRENGGGQYLHRLEDWRQPLPPISKPPKKRTPPTHDFATLARQLSSDAEGPRTELARALGVSARALADLGVGWDQCVKFWSFPERDAQGAVIGINARHLDGSKKRLTGSKAGLTYADGWDAGDGPILLVEGGSDTAALLGLGLNVVGRPSNTGGVDLLIELLAEIAYERPIIVIAERDKKADGKWPGKDGAVRTAQKLVEGLERPIGWSLPPDDAKDARAWLQKMPALPTDRLVSLWLDGLDVELVEPPPFFQCEHDEGPVLSLEEWRAWMVQARIASCREVGAFLDRSVTGTGKSSADYETIRHFLRGAAG